MSSRLQRREETVLTGSPSVGGPLGGPTPRAEALGWPTGQGGGVGDSGDGFPYRERQAAPTASRLSPSRIIGGQTVPCTWASAAMATARTAEATPMVSWVNADSSD